MQFDVLSGAFFTEVTEEEGEVLFDITLGGRVTGGRVTGGRDTGGRVSGPAPTPEPDDAPVEVRPSFDEVITDHYSQMIVNARHLTGDVTRADDVVHDAAVRAMRSWDRFLGRFETLRAEVDADEVGDYRDDLDTAVSAWLHRIVTNAFITAYHHGKRATRRVNQWAADQRDERGGNPDLRNDLDSPIGDEVERAITDLSGDRRKVIEMHYLRGMDCAEIAAELGLCKKTVFTRLHRAKAELGPLLKRYARERYGIGLGERSAKDEGPTPPSPAAYGDEDEIDDEDAA